MFGFQCIMKIWLTMKNRRDSVLFLLILEGVLEMSGERVDFNSLREVESWIFI